MTTTETPYSLDRDPTPNATAEWLVVSAQGCGPAAAEAVSEARRAGMRIDHLRLSGDLAGLEALILRAAPGARHIVVAETGAGALAEEVRRILPHIGVITAWSQAGPVPASLVLERLLRTPRCC